MKNPTRFTTAAVTLGLTFLTAASASATVIITENFGGLLANNLNATAADTFDSGITSAGGSSTWLAKTTDFRADGSVVGTGSTNTTRLGSASLNLGTYINAARGTANGVFVLSATISSVTGGSWLSLGFSSVNTPSVNSNFTTTNTGSGRANMIYRANGDIDQYRGTGSTNQVAADDVLFTGTHTLTITLDFSPAAYDGATTFGTAKFGADVGIGNAYLELGSSNFASVAEATIGSVMLSWLGSDALGNVTGGGYDNLSLTQIPEPAAALLGGIGLLSLLRRRR